MYRRKFLSLISASAIIPSAAQSARYADRREAADTACQEVRRRTSYDGNKSLEYRDTVLSFDIVRALTVWGVPDPFLTGDWGALLWVFITNKIVDGSPYVYSIEVLGGGRSPSDAIRTATSRGWEIKAPISTHTPNSELSFFLWVSSERISRYANNIAVTSDIAAEARYAAWKDLLNLRPDPSTLQAVRIARGHSKIEYTVQRIESASGTRVNFDEYTVDIFRMPASGPKETLALFSFVRQNLGDFLDTAVASFSAYREADLNDWKSTQISPLGTLMIFHIKVFGPIEEQAGVVTSIAEQRKWIFSPVTIGNAFPGEHPVSGNREFGFRDVTGLAMQFYLRGADRPIDKVFPPEEQVFRGADALWRSFQERLVKYVNDRGGHAVIGSRTVINDVLWDEVRLSSIWSR